MTKGICNLCHDAEYKNTKIDWNERKKLLDILIEKHEANTLTIVLFHFLVGKTALFNCTT